MKKIFIAVLAIGIFVSMASVSSAVTFQVIDCLHVKANTNGLITVTGNPQDVQRLTKMVQFCPDKFKGGCGDNRYIAPMSKSGGTATFQLNMSSARNGQRAFNFKSGKEWLLIPHGLVSVEDNSILEMSQPNSDSEDGKGGAHFVFTPAIR